MVKIFFFHFGIYLSWKNISFEEKKQSGTVKGNIWVHQAYIFPALRFLAPYWPAMKITILQIVSSMREFAGKVSASDL